MKKVAVLLFTLASLGPGMQAFADDYPNGCVDCHAKSESRDFRLNTLLARIGHGHHAVQAEDLLKIARVAFGTVAHKDLIWRNICVS